jgi:uncharacterized DUF497 family protein
MAMKLSWDPKKAKRNKEKHGIRFPDLEPIFEDERAMVIPEVTNGEERINVIGMDGLARIVVVSCIIHEDNVRIITARKANKSEKKQYGVE